MAMAKISRDRLAVAAGLLAPLAVTAVLVPFRASVPNTDAAPYERFTITRHTDIGTRASLEQRLVAVALADQAGAALASGRMADLT
jgi:hypothetical protein